MTEQDIVNELCKYFKTEFSNKLNDKNNAFDLECNILAYIIKVAENMFTKMLEEAGSGYCGTKIQHHGCEYKYKGNDFKNIHSLFGKIRIKHARYVLASNSEGVEKTLFPLDENLGFSDGHTPACHYFLTRFTSSDVYLEGVTRFNEIFRASGADEMSTRKAIDMTTSLGMALEENNQKEINSVMEHEEIQEESPIEKMAVFIDACKTPQISRFEDENREIKQTVSYRDAKIISVAQRGWDNQKNEVTLKQISHQAAVEHADDFFKRGYTEMIKRGKKNIEEPVVFVADGAAWIWDRIPDLAENRVEILDYYHATEHLSACVKILFGEETTDYKKYYSDWKELLYCGKIECVLKRLSIHKKRLRGKTRSMLLKEINYFNTHKTRMKYDQYRMNKYPIGSGTVESACKNVVACRMKRTGMKWSETGTTAMLQLRASLKSGTFLDDFKDCVLRATA